MKKKYLKARPLNGIKKPKDSKITITISGNEITGIENDTGGEIYSLCKDGFFIMSNYPLTIQCNGSGKDGYFGTVKCGECSGTGQADLYQKKDKC